MKKICHIVGAGRVGRTLALLLPQHPHWQLSHIVSQTLPPDAFGARICRSMADLPPADAVILAVPDNAIECAAAELAQHFPLRGTLVLHLSGAKSVAVLAAAAQRGALTASVHPVFAFADPVESARRLKGSLCALEAGSRAAHESADELAQGFGLQTFALSSEHKARYHAALSAAANFSVTLADFAQNLLQPLSLPDNLSRRLIGGLMRQSLDNLGKLPPLQALTGPIVRGDDETVAAHLAAMTVHEQALYRAWAEATLQLAQPCLDPLAQQKIQTALQTGAADADEHAD